MTNYTKQARAGIVREVALLHCDNVGATVEWERVEDLLDEAADEIYNLIRSN